MLGPPKNLLKTLKKLEHSHFSEKMYFELFVWCDGGFYTWGNEK